MALPTLRRHRLRRIERPEADIRCVQRWPATSDPERPVKVSSGCRHWTLGSLRPVRQASSLHCSSDKRDGHVGNRAPDPQRFQAGPAAKRDRCRRAL